MKSMSMLSIFSTQHSTRVKVMMVNLTIEGVKGGEEASLKAEEKGKPLRLGRRVTS